MGYYAKDEAGTTFWVDDQGKPSPVQTGNAGFPTVTIGSRDPGKAQAEARASEASARSAQDQAMQAQRFHAPRPEMEYIDSPQPRPEPQVPGPSIRPAEQSSWL